MTPQIAIVAGLLIPLLASAVVLALHRWPDARDAAMVLVAATLAPVLGITLGPAVFAGDRPGLVLFDMLPGVPVAFEVEPLGFLFAMVATSLWPITALYGVGYMRGHHEQHQTRFFAFFSAAITAAVGVAFAANLVTLFVFYEVLTLSTWPLVTHHQDEEARRGGRVYLGVLLSTSILFLLPAIVWTHALTGTTTFTPGGILEGHLSGWPLAALVALFAFGIGKAALMPFHRWLPHAMVAPTPVSALLHAVAVVKAGVFTVLKVVVYIFGLDFLSASGAAVWLTWVAAFTILAGSVIALTKDNLKERLAYSTVSQLAYIVLGAALATPLGIVGGGLHIVMHAFGKITLFFCAGAIAVATHRKKVSELVGLGRFMPWTFGAFFVGAVSVTGLPLGGGMWSKWYLALGALAADQPLLVAVLMTSTVLNAAYLLDIVGRGFFLPPTEETLAAGYAEASFLTVLPPVLSAAGCVVLFFAGSPIASLLLDLVSP